MALAASSCLTPMAWLRLEVVERLLTSVVPLRSVLEVGAGQGGFGARLAARALYLGLEPDEASARVAHVRVRAADDRARVVRGGIDAISPHAKFDLVCAFEVLEHLADDAAAIKAWSARARPGGALMLSVPAHRARYGAMDAHVGHYRRYDPDDLDALLTSAGLGVQRMVAYGFPLGYILEATRNRLARRNASKSADMSLEERTAASGRLYQPSAQVALLTRAATAPFRGMQRLTPGTGVGLVALARVPGG